METTIKIIQLTLLSLFIIGCGGGSAGESSSFRDSNNAPIINSDKIYYVSENTREAFQVKATDSNRLEYSLSGGDFFDLYIDKHTGEVFFKEPTKYSKKSVYTFNVIVEDILGHFTSQPITIYVKESQNNPTIVERNFNHPLSGVDEEDYFITTWKTDNQGISNSKKIIIPTGGDGYRYNVDWGDGTSTKDITLDGEHTYDVAGTYDIKITGDFPQLFFRKNSDYNISTVDSDSRKLVAIKQWGNIEWYSMGGAFLECSNLEGLASDIPNLTNVTDMSDMFYEAHRYNQDIEDWNVSHVTNMENMFTSAYSFNQYIGSWDVSNVINMKGMFSYATAFNHYIGEWDVSKVTNMHAMFDNAHAFTYYLGEWDTSQVTDMSYMFNEASAFNESISNWNVSNVTNMERMFLNALSFNQNLENWDVNNVTKMQDAFENTPALDKIPSWYKE